MIVGRPINYADRPPDNPGQFLFLILEDDFIDSRNLEHLDVTLHLC
ncbi:unnamed protein product [Cylicostephanus goldi]|uniref:Uncharacterized protein n=1 Tax=Cylicostephanus goldi TaxID=71465 RepID=A0A3P6V2Q1_CYLGO|nr:unnamed protein product [Cylicostephanus goldi]